MQPALGTGVFASSTLHTPVTGDAALQNGFNPKDTFDPIAELRRARAANAGQKLVDSHAKEEAVLGAALNAHGGDSANLDEDNVDVSLCIIVLHGSPGYV